MNEFYIKQTDRLPVIQTYLEDSNGYADLSSVSTVSFVYKPYYNWTSGTTTTGSASIVSVTSGLVQYNWGTGDVYTPGVFLAEWRATYSDGRESSFPNDGYIVFEIQPRLI